MTKLFLLILFSLSIGILRAQFSAGKFYPFSGWSTTTTINDYDADGELEFIVHEALNSRIYNVNYKDSLEIVWDDVNFIYQGLPPVLDKLQTADLNNDGLPDIVALKNNRFIAVYLNAGNSTFIFQCEYEFSPEIANFRMVKNLNGIFQVLAAPVNNTSTLIELVYNSGLAFNDTIFYDSTISNIRHFDYLRFDSDSDYEILIQQINSSYQILKKVNGTYVSIDTISAQIKHCEVFDFNADSLDDLFMYNHYNGFSGGTFALYENQNEEFIEINVVDTNVIGFNINDSKLTTYALFGDFNGDGLLDIAAHDNVYYDALSITVSASSGNYDLKQVIDVNGDGLDDWTTYYKYYMQTSDVINYGTIDSSSVKVGLLDFNSDIEDVFVIDYDQDDIEDVIVFYDDYGTMDSVRLDYLILNEPDGTVGEIQKLKGLHSLSKCLHVGDLTNNGFNDILFINNSSQLVLAKSSINYIFSDYDTLLYNGLQFVAEVGNIDNTNGDDIVYAIGSDLIILYNDGFGNFNVQDTLESSVDVSGIAISDFENDSFPEIVRVQLYSTSLNKIGVWRNNANIFQLDSIGYTNFGFQSVDVADLNADGHKDIYATYASDIMLFENDGLNEFNLINQFSVPTSYSNIELFNLDDDGLIDFLVTKNSLNSVAKFYRNVGNFNFSFDQDYTFINSNISNIMGIDMKGDGIDELVFEIGSHGLMTNINFNSEHYGIGGQVFMDFNGNGIKDSIDSGIDNQFVYNLTSNELGISHNQGHFMINADLGNNNIEIGNLNLSSMSLSTPSFFSITLDSIQPVIDSLLFGITFDSIYSDISIHSHTGQVRCNQSGTIVSNVINEGTVIENILIEVKLDDSLQFISSWPVSDSMVNNTLFFSKNSLIPFQGQDIRLEVVYPDFNSIGDTIFVNSKVYSIDSNANLSIQDSVTLESLLVCAYDPNDKVVNPKGKTERGFVPKYKEMEYLIRFQNTGNDTAVNVIIEDELSDKLNLESFKLLSWSHPLNVELNLDGNVQFIFNNIMLPDSGANFLGSQGYVKFEIQLDSSLNFGDEILNFADIYFDFNPAIVTNTTLTTVECPIPVINNIGNMLYVNLDFPVDWFLNDILIESNSYNVPISGEGIYKAYYNNLNGCEVSSELMPYFLNIDGIESNNFIAYPNPTSNYLNVKFEKRPVSTEVLILYNLQGEMIKSFSNLSNDFSIELNGLSNGFYFLKLQDGDSYSVSKKIILIR